MPNVVPLARSFTGSAGRERRWGLDAPSTGQDQAEVHSSRSVERERALDGPPGGRGGRHSARGTGSVRPSESGGEVVGVGTRSDETAGREPAPAARAVFG